jgi:predicted enzyme related to lactoylglutathione lyase
MSRRLWRFTERWVLSLSLTSRTTRFKSTVGNATFSVHADAVGEPAQTIVYFECSSLDQQVALLKEMGLKFAQEPRDEPWLWREARLVDPAGNIICLYHAGENRLNPPWRVKA